MGKSKTFDIYIDNNEKYTVQLNYRKRRSMSLRLNEEKKIFYCNVPLRTKEEQVYGFLNKYMEKLIKRVRSSKRPSPINGDFVYIFGEKKEIPSFSSWTDKKKDKYFKDLLLEFLIENVQKNMEIMDISNKYVVKVRKMTSRWGVNNKKSMSLTFTTFLVHYSKEIIETVVIHELVHDRVRGHGKDFYVLIDKYSPNYKELHKKLTKGIYE